MGPSIRIAPALGAALALACVAPGVAAGQVGENAAPGAPLRIAPPDGHRFDHGEPQRLTVVAFDPDLEPYVAIVTVLNADTQAVVFQGETHAAPSGVQASVVIVPPLPPGRYTWSAHARDVRGREGSESPSAGFEVGAPAVLGAGGVAGRLEYAAPGLPKVSCRATSFDVDADAQAAFLDLVFVGFAGPLRMTGTGGSQCEDMALGIGTVALEAQGVGPSGSEMACPRLEGRYTRVGPSLVATLTGECTVNRFSTGPLTWVYSAQVAPTNGGAGVTEAIRQTTFTGAFATRSLLTDAEPEI